MKIFKQLLGISIIMIAGFGIISNVLHFVGIRKTESIDLKTSTEYKQIEGIMSDIKSKKDGIKDLASISTSDMNSIKEYINSCYDGLNNVDISKYENVKNINDIDKFKLLNQIAATRCPAFTISALNIIGKYDKNIDKIKQIFAAGLYESMIELEPIEERLLHNYEYNTTQLDLPGGIARQQMYEFNLILNSIRMQSLVLQYLINYNLDNVGV